MNLGRKPFRRGSQIKPVYSTISLVLEKFLVICIIFYLSLSDLGPIYTWDMCKASENVNYYKNTVASTLGDTADFAYNCINTFPSEDSTTICAKSFYGLFFNQDSNIQTSSVPTYPQLICYLTSNTRFKDHSTNTIILRGYLNPSKVISNHKFPMVIMATCLSSGSPDCVGFGVGIQVSSNPKSFQLLGYKGNVIIDLTTFAIFADDKAPLINYATWVDLSISLSYEGASSTSKLTFKAYSQNAIFDSGYINVGEFKSGFTISGIDIFALGLLNNKAMDYTIQYVSVYGGSKTYEYIEESYGKTPPEGLSVPPEYCSDASDSFLLKGCTNKVGKKCKAQANCRCNNAKYQYELETKTIVGIAIGVSFGVDIIIMVIIFFWIFI